MDRVHSGSIVSVSTAADYIDNQFESNRIEQSTQKDEDVVLRRCSSAAKFSSAISGNSNEVDSVENKVTKRLMLNRSNTAPFQIATTSRYSQAAVFQISDRAKIEDTREILEILKASIQQPMNFPPIVAEQLRRHVHDPYINSIDHKFWSLYDSKEKHMIEKMLRKKLNKRMEKKVKEENINKSSKASKMIQRPESKSLTPAGKSDRLSAKRVASAGQKLPPIRTPTPQNDEVVEAEVDVSIQNEVEAEQVEGGEGEQAAKQEEVVKEVLIDSLDGIDKPGLFIPSAAHLQMPSTVSSKYTFTEGVQYKNEVHLFMSSFFLDSEVERAAILVKVIPDLRSIFASRGYELYYHDCHLGTNGISENHNLEEICLRMLNKSIEKSNKFALNGIRFMVFFGQKFGLRNLPNHIPVEEFETILATAKHTHDKTRRSSRFNKRVIRSVAFDNQLVESSINERNVLEDNTRLNPSARQLHDTTNVNSPAPTIGNEKDDIVEASDEPSSALSKSRTRSVRKTERDLVFTLTEKQETEFIRTQSDLRSVPKSGIASAQVDASIDPVILTQWYELDRTFATPVYVLKSLSSVLPDIANKRDAPKRQVAQAQWFQARKSLLKLFERYGSDFVNLTSTTENEITDFINEYLNTSEKASSSSLNQLLVIDRTIVEYNLNAVSDTMLQNYFDIKKQLTPELNQKSLMQIQYLKNRISESVHEKSRLDFVVNWLQDSGVSPFNNREHLIYIDRMCKQIKHQILKSWDPILNKKPTEKDESGQERFDFETEIKQHRRIFLKSCKQFLGSRDTLGQIRSYLNSISSVPLILLGEHGSGKTALLNECIKELSKISHIRLVVRCCGKTQLSTNQRLFLKNLSQEIDMIFSDESNERKKSPKRATKAGISDDLSTLKNTFANRLEKANVNNQLVIILDGIDSIKSDYDESLIDWIPRELPPYVHMVISFNPTGEKGEKLNNQIKKNFGKTNTMKVESFMLKRQDEILTCSGTLVRKFLEQSMKRNYHNNLNDHVSRSVVHYFKEIANNSSATLNPLFCSLLFKYFEHIISFKSFIHPGIETIAETLTSLNFKSMLDKFYVFMERKFGEVFVKRALGYIGAYHYCGGCTENELLDLLSLDDAVVSSVSSDLTTGYKCVPEAFWLSLKSMLLDLDCLLEVHNPGGYRCVVFKHTVFYDAVNDRYFQQRDKSVSYFKVIVNYYLNQHASIATTQAIQQPMELITVMNGQKVKIPNVRRLNLLAYHLCGSGSTVETVKQALIFNFSFIQAKLVYTDFESLMEDLNLLIYSSAEFTPALQVDIETKTFIEFLGLSEGALRVAPDQLYSQLTGRLSALLEKASEKKAPPPGAEGGEQKQEASYTYLKDLVNESRNYAMSELSGNMCFLPNSSFMIQPGQMNCEFLKGFLSNLSTFTTIHDGTKLLTFEYNGACKLWDLKNQRLLKTFYKIKDVAKQARFAMGNLYLITVTVENVINVWNIRTSEKLLTINEYDNEIPQITVGGAPECRYLVVCYGCKNISNWSLVDFKKLKTVDLQSQDEDAKADENGVKPEKSILDSTSCIGSKVVLTKTCNEDRIGYAFKGTSHAYIFDSKAGTVVNKYTTKFESGFIFAIELTNDYFVIVCKLTSSRGADKYKIEIQDNKRPQLMRVIDGCFSDNLVDVSLNMVGSHIVCTSHSESTQSSELTFWNIESEEHRHLCLRGTIVPPNKIISTDLRFVLTSSVGHPQHEGFDSRQIKIWNLAARFGNPGGKYQTYDDDGIEGINILQHGEQSKLALTRHFENRRVNMWDLDTVGKSLKTPDAVFEGGKSVVDASIVFKANDIILTFNDINMLYILTDKGVSDSADGEASPIFQSIQVFDLKEQSYEYKISNLFICAYDTNEFLILENKTAKLPENEVVLVGLSETRNHFIVYSIKTGHIVKRMRTNFKEEKRKRANEQKDVRLKSRKSTAAHDVEKAENTNDAGLDQDKETKNIEQFIVSADHSTAITAYHAHHLCVFDLNTFTHIQTLEDPNCVLLLYASHLTNDGRYLVHHTYDTTTKHGYITIWDCKMGKMKRRLKNETGVVSIAMSEDVCSVVFCKQNGDVKFWNPMEHESLRTLKYDKRAKGKLEFEMDTKIHLIRDSTKAIILSGKTYSLWDVKNTCLLSVFTNDFKFTCYSIVLNESTLLFGHKTSTKPICIRLPE